jgi:hypothetical protein
MVSVEFNRFINYYKKLETYLLNQVKDVKEAMIESLERIITVALRDIS